MVRRHILGYESFFVSNAYVPGANDPYKAPKTTLKAEIDVARGKA